MTSQFHTIRVHEVIRETPDACTIVFEIPGNLQTAFQYKPGQYITVSVVLNGEEERRAYSFSSSPYTNAYPAVTVKKVTDGRVSPYLNDILKAGDTVKLMPPLGKFTTDIRPENKNHYILFGGGSGITPVMSILKSILDQEPLSILSLIYANRDEESIIFDEELKALAITNPDRLKIVHCLENPKDAFSGFKGRPGISDYQEITRSLWKQDYPNHYFICGPGGMMDAVKTSLLELNIPDEEIHVEYFAAPIHHKAPVDITVGQVSEPFKGVSETNILYNGKEFNIKVPEGVTILEAAKDQKVDPPYACQMGVCTTCRAKVLEGSVHMEEREGLSDSEMEEGYVLTCQSIPTSAKIKLIYE